MDYSDDNFAIVFAAMGVSLIRITPICEVLFNRDIPHVFINILFIEYLDMITTTVF